MDEVQVLAKLDHPNIVHYHDCFMDEVRGHLPPSDPTVAAGAPGCVCDGQSKRFGRAAAARATVWTRAPGTRRLPCLPAAARRQPWTLLLTREFESEFQIFLRNTNPLQVYINIVMEYCDGGDLTGLIRSRKGVLLPEDDVMNKFVQASHRVRSEPIWSHLRRLEGPF
jgi:serine/threonine protein kinase